MKTKLLFKVLLLFIIIFSLSCEDDDLVKPETERIEGVIPLKVGYQWTWNIYKINGEEKSLMHQYSVEVIKDTIIDGEKWYIERENNQFNTDPYTNREGVVYSYSQGVPIIVFNTSIEDTSIQSTNANRSYSVSKNNIVEIPLGKFNCNLYQIFEESNGKKILRSNYYISYNKGIIKVEDFGCVDSLCSTSTMELVSTNAF